MTTACLRPAAASSRSPRGPHWRLRHDARHRGTSSRHRGYAGTATRRYRLGGTPMTPAELRAAGRLGGHAFAGVVSRIEQVHQAVAGRAFGPIRHAGAPARFIHDNVSRSVYLAVRSAGSAAGAMLGEVLSPLGAGGQPTSSTPKGNLALSA